MRKSAAHIGSENEVLQSTGNAQLTVDAVAVQLEPGVIQYEVDSSTSVVPQIQDSLPETLQVVPENILLCSSEVVAAGGLERLDLILSHVDEERQIRRIAPKANCSEASETRAATDATSTYSA